MAVKRAGSVVGDLLEMVVDDGRGGAPHGLEVDQEAGGLCPLRPVDARG